MDKNDLEKIVKKLVKLPKETELVEFKCDFFKPDVLAKNISALSNSANLLEEKCAYLLFGIKDDNHQIVGTNFSPKNEKVGNMELEHWLMQRLNREVNFSIYEFSLDSKNLVMFQVFPATYKPVQSDKVSYIRIGSNTTELSKFPNKESKIWSNIQKNSFEKCIAKEGLSANEVLELLDYSNYFSLTKQELPSDTKLFVERMSQHGLVKKVLDDYYDITNLGAILFAKDLNNFNSIKRKLVRVIIYSGNTREKRLKEYNNVAGYAISFDILLKYINDKLPYNEEIKSLRKEVRMYPELALREFIANALIHQDLSITGTGPMIEIFDNRIDITNPGKPLIEVNRFIDHPPRSRNEDLASFMRQVGICEECGTGIDRALTKIELFQLPAPMFTEFNDSLRVTIFGKRKLKDMSHGDRVRACYQHCVLKFVEGKKMTNSTLRKRLGINDSNYPAASKIISDTLRENLIKESEKKKEYVPFWA